MVDISETGELSPGERAALISMIRASHHRHATTLIEYVASAKVRRVNDDGSILAFCSNGTSLETARQRIIEPTGYVEDDLGLGGEVILFEDDAGQLTEFEIVSVGEHVIGPPKWDTFRLAPDFWGQNT
jgi:hypothetical protein